MTARFAFFRGCFVPIRLPHLEYVTRKVLPKFGIELIDAKGFTCCPEPVGFSLNDRLTWTTIAARNLCVAEEQNLDIITVCNGCYYTLKHAYEELRDSELREMVNDALAGTGHEYKGKTKVKHFVQILNDDIGLTKLRSMVVKPLQGLKIAAHTGCHFSNRMGRDVRLLDTMLEALGSESVEYNQKNLCCGWTISNYGKAEAANNWFKSRFEGMKAAGADCSAVICPQCFQQYDMGQLVASRKVGLQFKIPVFFYPQLLGLSMGFSLEEMQYDSHRVKDVALEEKLRSILA